MFQVEDIVLYGNEGVCKIIDICSRMFRDKEMEYYVLKPIYTQNATVYVPKGNEDLVNQMKKILSKEEILALIEQVSQSDLEWIDNDNLRKEKYRNIIKSGDRLEMMKLVKILYQHQQKLKKIGKKFHANDDKIFKEAEKILYDEFAYVLNIQQEEVIPFIAKQIDVKERDRTK